MGKIADYFTGRDLLDGTESRTIAPGTVAESWTPITRTALPAVTESSALKIADVFAAVRTLTDLVASLPPRVYRETPRGPVATGEDQRLVSLLRRPEPGSTAADLFSQMMVSLLVSGDAFLAKYRSEGTITQLGVLDPQAVTVERQGAQIIYSISRREGLSQHGVEDVLHVKSMSGPSEVTGISTVRAAGKALALDAALVDYACNWLAHAGTRPGGILALSGDMAARPGQAQDLKTDWEELFGGENAGRLAVLSGDSLNYEAVEPAMRDSEFAAQRELSVREIARVFNLPPWALGASSGDAMTYSNVAMQNRYLVDHSLRPWIARIEGAFSNDPDLLPGNSYMSFDTDALLRADPEARANYYTAALNGGWLTRDEIREREDLPPLEGT